MNEKYIMIPEDKPQFGRQMYRIQAVTNFGDVKKGDFGGLIESCNNLSQFGECWIENDVAVMGNAIVINNARVRGYCVIEDLVRIEENAVVSGWGCISGEVSIDRNAKIDLTSLFDLDGRLQIGENADVKRKTDIFYIGPIGSRNDFTTFYKGSDSKIYVRCGCFCGDIDQFIKRVHKEHGYFSQNCRDYLDAVKIAKRRIKFDD